MWLWEVGGICRIDRKDGILRSDRVIVIVGETYRVHVRNHRTDVAVGLAQHESHTEVGNSPGAAYAERTYRITGNHSPDTQQCEKCGMVNTQRGSADGPDA